MKLHRLYEQMEPKERAELLLSKYSLNYVKDCVNGLITMSRKNDEALVCNYWNEVAKEIKNKINYGK